MPRPLTTDSRSTAAALAALFILLSLRPHPDVMGPVAALYIADAVVALVALYWTISHGASLLIPKQAKNLLAVGLIAVAFLTAITILSGYGRLTSDAVINIGRFAYYVGLLVVVAVMATATEIEARTCSRLLDLVLSVNVVVAIIQATDPPFVGEIVRSAYGSTKLRSLATGSPRVYGTFFNSNWFGVYLVFTLLGWLWLRNRGGLSKVGMLLRAIAVMVLVFLSGSRTGVVGVAVGLLLYFALRRRMAEVLIGVLLVVGGGGMMVGFARLVPTFENPLARFHELVVLVISGDVDVVRTLVVRIEQWRRGLAAFQANMWVGYGDSGLGGGFMPHNSTLVLLLMFGLLGGGVILAWFGSVFRAVSRTIVGDGHLEELRRWFISFTGAFVIMAQAGDFVNTSQLVGLWIILAGVILGQEARRANNIITQI